MRVLVVGGFLLAALVLPAVAVAAEAGDAITGTWLTNDGTSRVQISNVQGVYDGRVVWLKEPLDAAGKPKVDRQNPDASLRSRQVMGLAVLTGLHYTGSNAWDGGTIYTPATGKSYPCKVTLAPDGTLKLVVGGSVFGRTLTWTRATGAQS